MFYEAAHELGLSDTAAQFWDDGYFEQLADGHALKVVADLESECADYDEGSELYGRFSDNWSARISFDGSNETMSWL